MNTKYIFVTGGVASSLGKGIVAASLAKLLQARGLRVTIQKFDPYINIDPGTLNPYEHGECYVTEDGAETDLDLGHYERFLNVRTSKANNVTTGKIYKTVIDNERAGVYLGKTVQIIPHITDEIKRRMTLLGKKGEYDVIITEIGGTVGDMESTPFLEAVRQFKWEMNEGDCIIMHLTLVPLLHAAAELKTKPTQHSVKMLRQEGINPDIIVCRTEVSLPEGVKRKIALFCNVKPDSVFESRNAKSIYELPIWLNEQGLDRIVLKKLKIKNMPEPDLKEWKLFITKLFSPKTEVNIALVGKYVELQDAYKSIQESFVHAGAANSCKVNVHTIHSEYITPENIKHKLRGMAGILVAPGFGERGLEGKILAVEYARKNKIPFFGICLGMQMAVIEYARNVLNYKDANSTEVNPSTPHPVIDLMQEQKSTTIKGGTMRLGAYDCNLKPGTLIRKIYGKECIQERHRHRYEFNEKYAQPMEKAGLILSGINPQTGLVEAIELPQKVHPFFIGVQFHPELGSTVLKPQPIFVAFVKAALKKKRELRGRENLKKAKDEANK